MNLKNQQNAAREELQKPFPQEQELAEKSARLAELDAALNMVIPIRKQTAFRRKRRRGDGHLCWRI